MNWKSAVGEVILIVVGVTIAMAGNSWYERRHPRQDEAALHAILETTIREDLAGLQSAYDVYSDLAIFRANNRDRWSLPGLRAAMDQMRGVMDEIE